MRRLNPTLPIILLFGIVTLLFFGVAAAPPTEKLEQPTNTQEHLLPANIDDHTRQATVYLHVGGQLPEEDMVIIIRGEQRLCQDGKWRTFANLGSYPGCVKEYRSTGHAQRMARRTGGKVVVIPENMELTAAGEILEHVPAPPMPGYERVRQHRPEHFVLTADNRSRQKTKTNTPD